MIVQSAKPFSFNYGDVNHRDTLNVRADVFDVTGTPVRVAQIEMPSIGNGIYIGSFTADVDKLYEIVKLVYTDNTFTVVDPDFSPESDDIQSIDFATKTNFFPGGQTLAMKQKQNAIETVVKETVLDFSQPEFTLELITEEETL